MPLTGVQTIIMILAVALGAMCTRFPAFLLFPENKEPPKVILYLGGMLPPAMMGLLVIYCLKGVSFGVTPYGAPEIIAIAATVLLHLWKRNTLLSIGAGTAVYMLLVQVIFA